MTWLEFMLMVACVASVPTLLSAEKRARKWRRAHSDTEWQLAEVLRDWDSDMAFAVEAERERCRRCVAGAVVTTGAGTSWVLAPLDVLKAITSTNKPKEFSGMNFKIELGTKVKDRVTGYAGIVIGRTEWLYGCRRYTVQTQEMKDGKPVDSMGFDEDALEVLDAESLHIKAHKPANTGGPETRAPSRPRDATLR
jgi:hypothetical protein